MTAILDIVKSWQPLADMIARGDGTWRLYPDVAPADAPRPMIVYSQVAKDAIQPLNGLANADYDRFTFDCWATERDDAQALAAALRDAFDHYLQGRPFGYLAAGFQEMFDPEARAFLVAFDWGIWTNRGGPPLQP
jgi:hypothetical protein